MSKSALQLLDDLIAELEVCTADLVVAEVVPKEEKKAKKAKPEKADKPASAPAPAAAPAAAAEMDINSLDLRVGVIRSVKKHETAEKLYCEEIDVGEEAPRAIASGLVPYYTLEQMDGRRLIAVCNLKPRNLVGFKSHGMVLCASTEGSVEFIDPPATAAPGDRLLGEGLPVGPPMSLSKADKVKAWEVLAADLAVNADGEATWKGHRLLVNGLPCTAPTLRNVPIH